MIMNKSLDIYFLVPLHKWDEKVYNAISSIPDLSNVKYFVITTNELSKIIIRNNGGEELSVLTVPDNHDTSYQSLVNYGVDHVKSICNDDCDNFVSILEYDDVLYPNVIANIVKYHNHYNSDIYAPLVSFVEEEDGSEQPKLLSFGNEACWAGGTSEEIGLFDFNMLLRMNFVFLNSCFINLNCFDFGGLKPKIKAFYDYEFILRMVYNGKIIRGIPKITHKHYMNPDGAMMNMVNNLTKEERDYWLTTSRKEYFFESDEDRNIAYQA